MAVLDRFTNPKPVKGPTAPKDVLERIERGREAMRKDHTKRRLCVKFWQGEHYWYLNPKGALAVLDNTLVGGSKPDHRIRNTYNFAHSIVEGKVSAASQRVPGYEVDPTTTDPEDNAGARIATNVAYYGYDKWRLRRQTKKVITNALVQREGFVMPYFDSNVGPFITTLGENGQPKRTGLGEVKLLNLTRSEVGWEPGEDFDDSPWHMIERAMLIEKVKQFPGYIGGDLTADASTHDLPTQQTRNHVLATIYLERPCTKYPEGRRMVLAGGKVVVDNRAIDADSTDWWEPYPSQSPDGTPSDEPVIHRLSYTVDPEGDDRGLVEHIIDLSRTVDDCWNKLLEWKNRCLMPQRMAPKGSNVTRANDIPGGTSYYNVVGGQKPEWEKTPAVPHELFQMLELAIQHMRALAADVDVQPEPDLAARTANAAIEQAGLRWQSFLGDLAEFHSRLMRHCLTLVAKHYGEQRILDIRGQYGWEPPTSFTGQDMRNQVNVRVRPGSIEAKSRTQAMQEVSFLQQNWPGSVSPEAALAVMHGSPAEGLMKSYENHTARAWKVCMKLRAGPSAMAQFTPRVDFELGDPAAGFLVPGWMPRKVDNIAIWKTVVADFMTTDQYDQLPAETQHMYDLIFDGLEAAEQRRSMMIAMQQQSEAAALGMGNAAAPQSQPGMPSPKGLTPEQSAPDAVSPQ